MSDLDSRYLTVQEVAADLRLEESTVYKMCRTRQLPSVRFGKKAVRIPRLAFERYLQFVDQEADPAQALLEEPHGLAIAAHALRGAQQAASSSSTRTPLRATNPRS